MPPRPNLYLLFRVALSSPLRLSCSLFLFPSQLHLTPSLPLVPPVHSQLRYSRISFSSPSQCRCLLHLQSVHVAIGTSRRPCIAVWMYEKVRYEKPMAFTLLEFFCFTDDCNVRVRVGWVYYTCHRAHGNKRSWFQTWIGVKQ